ncbi:hypothetical protein K402DRAFT_389464 [Aulographum hederae CBS 113979]|uniref:VASt domain-containing protein n=1 Tax=Aulographum hederae CBS 113979 TaxID=1176131 RepID=A0A6G1HDI2_9PEZI|nr:hypothetical protein K402DRAFT_389464 [Aulographum hederae CBS 113979]
MEDSDTAGVRKGLATAIRRRSLSKPTSLSSTTNLSRQSSNASASAPSVRASMDGAMDRLKNKIPGRLRRKKESSEVGSPDSLDIDDPFSPAADHETGLAVDSTDSLRPRSIASSLVTEDSDCERDPTARRPNLATHDSHAGYLTLSSPLIAAEAIESSTPSAISLNDTLAPKHSQTLPAPSSNQKRASSPVGKLKEAFTPSRRSSTTKAALENDNNKPSSNGGGGGEVGGLQEAGGSRRNSFLEDLRQFDEPREISSRPSTATLPAPINTSFAPSTPPSNVTPQTLVTPPTPTDPDRPDFKSSKRPSNPDTSNTSPSNGTSSPPNKIQNRRMRLGPNPPSKLSNAISAPLTPAIEEVKTPGGTLTSPPAGGGFFSSVFTAAQNAANQLTNSIGAGTTTQRNRSGTGPDSDNTGEAGGEEVILPHSVSNTDVSESGSGEKRQLAIDTLGTGNLSLSHLGIVDDSKSTTSLSDNFAPTARTMQNDEASAMAEDDAAARAVSAAYETTNVDGTSAFPEPSSSGRPQSVVSANGDHTPTRSQSAADPGSGGLKRTGSVRSRISGRRRRHRGSSAATGQTLASGLSANGTVNTAIIGSGHRLTGFAVANPKRNRDFHQLFRSVPEDDYLIEDYSAALQREILLQGRIYISEGHICFSSNILGWVTNLVISFDEIISIEKKSTAVIFPNAIVIQTLHARNVFASLVSRDTTYDLMIGIWKISHPTLKSSLNGVTLNNDGGTGDKTEKADSVATDDESVEGTDDEVYDEDDDEEEADGSFIEAGEASTINSENGEPIDTSVSRKVSSGAVGAAVKDGSAKEVQNTDTIMTGASASTDFPGPPTHTVTECGDDSSHHERVLTDTTIPAPLGKIYSMMFGPASGAFMRKWLIEDQKSIDLQMEDDKKGLGEEKKAYSYSFIKPLNASIGPKQTKCIINQTLEQFDLEKAVTVSCATQNPDVPSGNIFVVKTRYCLMWAPGNQTRLIMTCTVEWSGKSWLKGPIEKGANDGQTQYARDIVTALRAAVTVKSPFSKAQQKGKTGKSRRKKGDVADAPIAAVDFAPMAAKAEPNWGLLEPLRGTFGPIADVVGGVITAQVVIAVLAVMVAWLWWRQQPAVDTTVGRYGQLSPARMAAYEQIWRQEEGELWRWLDERVGVDSGGGLTGVGQEKTENMREKKARGMARKLEDGVVGDREVEEALGVTRRRLEALEDAVRRRKEKEESLS